MPETMLHLNCPNCKEEFLLYFEESIAKTEKSKKPKNLTKLYSRRVEEAINNPRLTDVFHTKFHYEIIK